MHPLGLSFETPEPVFPELAFLSSVTFYSLLYIELKEIT